MLCNDIKITSLEVYQYVDKSHDVWDSTAHIAGFSKMFLKVNTNYTDIYGIGIGYLEFGYEVAREAYKVAENTIAGENPLANEAIADKLFWRFRGARKGYAFSIMSVIDIALWDIKGKVAGMPVYQLLGGSKISLPVYSSGGWTSYTKEELVEEALKAVEDGYSTIKIKVGYKRGTEPKEDIRRIEAVRNAIGDDIGLMIDANNAWTAGEAAKFIQDAEQYNLLCFEEPTIADDYEGLAYVRSKTNIPLATGEHEYTKYGVRDLILNKSVDILQVDVSRCGGITEMLKINGIAQAWNLRFAPHCIDLVSAHVLSASSNGMILERLRAEDGIMEAVFPDAPKPINGMLTLTDKPGLGLDADWELLKAYSKQ